MSAWEMVASNIAQDDRTTNVQGFYTLQNQEQGKEDTTDTVSHDNTRNTTDTLCMLYAKAAKRQDMNFYDYCTHIHNLNTDQCHIVIYNRAWCKSYINTVRHCYISQCWLVCIFGYLVFNIYMVLGCLGVWLCIFGLVMH